MNQNDLASLSATRALVSKAADQKYCHSCGRILHLAASSCTDCGAPQAASSLATVANSESPSPGAPALQANHVFCRGCGAAIHETARDCPKCGAPQKLAGAGVESVGGKSRIVAALLAFFLGGLGVHKFYLGSILQGFLYLLMCWTFIPSVIAFIEGIYYLAISDAEFCRKY